MYKRKVVFYAACLGMLIFGIVMTTIGAILPSLMETFDLGHIGAGALLTFMTFGVLGGSLFFGPIVDRYGYKYLLIISAVIIVFGLEMIAYTSSIWVLRLTIVIVGFFGGVINGGTNALVADISDENKGAQLSLLGVFFGIGAVGVPFTLGALLDEWGYEKIIAIVGLTVVLPVIYFAAIRFPSAKHSEGLPIKEGLGLTRETTLLLLGFILFFESGLEMTTGGWTSTYFHEELNVIPSRAAIYLALYWMGQMIARLVLGKILTIYAPAAVLRACLSIGIVGSMLCILSSNVVLAVVGVFLIGVGFAAGFPVILGYVGESYPKITGTAFSLVFSIALLGGMALPYLTGLIRHISNFRVSFTIVPISLIIMIILLQIVLGRMSRANQN